MLDLPTFDMRFSLTRHTKSINTLAISPDGHLLLSGGDDALLVLWDVHTGESLQEISCSFNGAVTSAIWIPEQHGIGQAFAFGCSDGSLQVYYADLNQQQPKYSLTSYTNAHDGSVEDIAFEQTHRRLASIGHGTLQVWNLHSDYSIAPLHPRTTRKQLVARSVQFGDGGDVVLVFFLENHEVVAYNIEPFTIKWTAQIPTRIGHATFSTDHRSLLISNLVNGVDSYAISATSPMLQLKQSYLHSIRCNVPLIVTSAFHGKWVICGSDDGSVRLFDQRSGEMFKCLQHGNLGTLVQIVAARSDGDSCMIVSGSSSPGPSDIKIWHTVIKQGSGCKAGLSRYKFSSLHLCLIVLVASFGLNMIVSRVPYVFKALHSFLLELMLRWGDPEDIRHGGSAHQSTNNTIG